MSAVCCLALLSCYYALCMRCFDSTSTSWRMMMMIIIIIMMITDHYEYHLVDQE